MKHFGSLIEADKTDDCHTIWCVTDADSLIHDEGAEVLKNLARHSGKVGATATIQRPQAIGAKVLSGSVMAFQRWNGEISSFVALRG